MSKTFTKNTVGSCRLCLAEDTSEESMISCYECDRWFHLGCVKLTQKPKSMECWLCIKCRKIAEELIDSGDLTKETTASKNDSISAESALKDLMIGHKEQAKEQLQEFLKVVTTLVDNRKEPSHIEILLRRQSLMQLSRFGGDAKDWQNYKRSFEKTNKEGTFSNLENLNRLNNALYGNALKSVQQLMMNSENVPEIMKRLNENFGRPDLVYLELLNNLHKIRRESKNVVSEMVNALENLVQNVNLMEEPDCLKDTRLVMELISKLPHHIQVKRAKYMTEAESPLKVQRLDDLCEWLKPYAKTVDMLNAISAHSPRGNFNLHDQQHPAKAFQQPINTENTNEDRARKYMQ